MPKVKARISRTLLDPLQPLFRLSVLPPYFALSISRKEALVDSGKKRKKEKKKEREREREK